MHRRLVVFDLPLSLADHQISASSVPKTHHVRKNIFFLCNESFLVPSVRAFELLFRRKANGKNSMRDPVDVGRYFCSGFRFGCWTSDWSSLPSSCGSRT